jgi:hypothetical protein
MSKRSRRRNRQPPGLYTEPVVVLKDGTIHKFGKADLHDPTTRIMLSISGMAPTRRGKRKKRYKRIVVDPLNPEECFKVKTPKKLGPHDWFKKRPPLKLGKKIVLRDIFFRQAMKEGQTSIQRLVE